MTTGKFLTATVVVALLCGGHAGAQQTFQYCLRMQPNPGVLECAGRQALTALSEMQESDNFTIDAGFMVMRNEYTPTLAARQLPSFLEQDPTDFRGMLENAGAIIGQRSLQWDLSAVQPGLCLRIGPSAESTSMLEFVMDPRHDRKDRFDEQPSSARLIARQFVVPFLLGLKFNLITVLPLFFGLIILLCKKAAFLGKLALFVTGLLGYGSAFSLGSLGGLFGGGGGFGATGFGGGFGGVPIGPGFGGVRPPFLNDVNVNVQSDPIGYFKGYGDEYRRQEKKLSAVASTLATTPSSAPLLNQDLLSDHFYDYERQVLQQDRHSTMAYKPIEAEPEAEAPTKGYRSFVWTTQT